MISYIKGALGAVEDDVIVVETGGIGLAVHVPPSLLQELPALGEEVTVYTYFQVREDAMTLYGFLHRQDREMFKQLIGVNGIGPKGALGILSIMRPDDLRIAIVSGDAKAISKAPGPPFNPDHFCQCFSCQTLCLSCSFDICAEGFKTGTIFNFRHITSPSYIV